MTMAQAPDYAPEWHAWIAENLIRGAQPYDIQESMVAQGLDRGTAQRAVAQASEHPYLVGARSAIAAGLPGTAQVAAAQPSSSDARTKKYAWFLEVARRNAQLGSHFGEVPRVHKPSAQEFLDHFYSQNKPVIIEGALDDWPALELWQSGDYLKSRNGDATVEVQANRESDADYELNSVKFKKEMNFGEFVDIIESGVETNDWYITANNTGKNLEALRPLRQDIRYPEYLTNDPNEGFFWYGPKGVVTPIHHDLTNNFMAQVRGRKLVRIVAPYESAHVYNNRHCFSPVDLFNVDEERFPEMKDVRVIDVEIGPGDLFFLPVGWWHAVRGLDISITMTFTNFIYPNDFYSFYETTGEI
jgi:Cupin-like domain